MVTTRSSLERIRPFVNLIREDSFGRPLVTLTDSIYVTAATTRRSTGTHYTPPSLTEPIVQHTLEPLVYEGPAEGLPREQWKLKSPKAILDLKVCDMAMGSGAFLVQACRYLAERLVEAWENVEKQHPGEVLITPEGKFSTGSPSERLVPADTNERIAIARRVVADRCLYGVDINPMAVEMAKLSLWLITLQRDRPFTFLDHALKCGDSLLGVSSIKQIENFSLRPANGRSRSPPPTCSATWRKPPPNAAPWKTYPPTTIPRSKPRTACTPKPKPQPPRLRRWPTASSPLNFVAWTAKPTKNNAHACR